ncbi:vWA domain-containing protein [Planctomycetaceae bacterium SH139]
MGPFAAGAMLFWGSVAAVPIVLHLLRRRRHRAIQWGAMGFLRAAIAQRARRFQLWRLLLLLLRVAAVLMIAVALARPQLAVPKAAADGDDQPPRLRVLVLDASHSMRAFTAQPPATRFDRARQAAQGLCNAARRGDGLMLVRMEQAAEAIVRRPSFLPEAVAAELLRMQPGDGTANLPAAQGTVEQLVQTAVDEGWSGPVDVIFFSDLQQVSWQQSANFGTSAAGTSAAGISAAGTSAAGSSAAGTSAAGTSAAGTSAAGSSVIKLNYWVVDCAPPGPQAALNLIPLEFEVLPADRAEGAGTQGLVSKFAASRGGLSARAGQSSLPAGNAQLLRDGRVDRSQPFAALSAGERRSLAWSTRLRPGRQLLEVQIDVADALPADNQIRQLVDRQETIRIAIFGQTPADTRFLKLALQASGEQLPGSDSFRTDLLGWDDLARVALGRYDLWMLSDPAPLTSDQANRLEQHLAAGGGVVWWLGPSWLSGSDGPVSGEQIASSPAGWRAEWLLNFNQSVIDPQGYASPLVAPFEPFPGAGLLTLPVFRQWALQLGNQWQAVLTVSDGGQDANPSGGVSWPLLATRGGDDGAAGRQVIVSSPPGPGDSDQPWNAMIAWPVFVPLVQEMVQWAGVSTPFPTAFQVGTPLAGRTPESEMGTQLVNEQDENYPVEITSRIGRSAVWSAGLARQVGVYRWADGPAAGELVAVVNHDPREADLAKLDRLPEPLRLISDDQLGELTAATNEPPNSEANEPPTGTAEQPAVAAGGASAGDQQVPLGELGWYWLLAGLGLMIAESTLVRCLEGRY